MKTRVQLKMTWMITFAREGAPFSKLEDFYAHARHALVDSFAHYGAELSITVAEQFFDSMAILELVWDVNLDMVPGGYHSPRDHEKHAQHYLKDGISLFANRLKIDILRHPDAENDVDGATDLVAWTDDYYDRCWEAAKVRLAELDAA